MESFKERYTLFWHKTLNRPYRLYVEHHGNPKNPVILLLHGIAASGDDWKPFLPILTKKYYCITIDLLGFGNSPKPQWNDYRMLDHTRSLFHTINKLDIGKKFTIAGHSLGSFLAAQYAREHHGNLDRLLLLSPPVYPAINEISRPTARVMTGALLRLYQYLRSEKMTPQTFRKLSLIAPLPKSILKNPKTWLPFMRTLQECIESQSIINDIRHLPIPVDVFYGNLDQVVVAANIELLKTNPNVRIHPFIGTHDLTSRYARKVARQLER